MFSVVMLVLNGLIGLSLILGALRYKEQSYNLRGANAYLSVIVSLAVFGLVVPNFTFTTPGPTFSGPQEGFLIIMCLGLYAVFLAIQTTRHRAFFLEHGEDVDDLPDDDRELVARDPAAIRRHVVFLVVYLVLVLYLVEKLRFCSTMAWTSLGRLLRSVRSSSPRSCWRPKDWAGSRRRLPTRCSVPSTSCWGRRSRHWR
jgi:Ca2+:H+ antiporter